MKFRVRTWRQYWQLQSCLSLCQALYVADIKYGLHSLSVAVCKQGEGLKGAQHLEAVRMKVREQREAMAATSKELRRLKKTLKTYEVVEQYTTYAADVHTAHCTQEVHQPLTITKLWQVICGVSVVSCSFRDVQSADYIMGSGIPCMISDSTSSG